MSTVVVAPTATPTLPAKFDQLQDDVALCVYERGAEIETMVTALVAACHHVMIGLPGIAKSLLVTEMVARLNLSGEEYFHWLLDRFTTPEALFGPISLKAMENDEYRRNTANKLPKARIANLEEIFKGSNAILNTLLTLMNEGIYFNNGVPTRCRPLFFGTSNELPTGAEMAPMLDRVTFRHFTKPMANNDSIRSMFNDIANRARGKQKPDQILTWAEIEEAQAAAALVELPDEVLDALLELKVQLKREKIEPTDRRFGDCIRVIQATAWRAGRSVADIDDMRLLRHVLWINVADIATVDRLVLALASPLDNAARELILEVDAVAAEFDTMMKSVDNDTQRRKLGVQLNAKMARLGKDLAELQDKAKANNKRSAMITEARTRLRELMKALRAIYTNTP